MNPIMKLPQNPQFFLFCNDLGELISTGIRGTESSSSIEGKRERSKLASCQV